MSLFEERDHARDVRVGLRERDTRLQPGQRLEVEHHEAHAFELHREQQVRIDAQEPERGGQHADDLADRTVDVDRCTEDIRGAAELALPVAVGQDHPQRAARGVVLLAEEAANCRLHAQKRQCRVRDGQHLGALRLAAPGDRHLVGLPSADVLEYPLVVAVCEVRRGALVHHRQVDCPAAVIHADQPLGLVEGQRLQ